MAATDILTEEHADHLLRRAGFGPRPGEVGEFAGKTREQAVNQLLGAKTRKSKPPAKRNNDFDTFRRMQKWWMQQMRSPKWRLHEQMTLFWHDHFPSSYNVVFELRWLATQNGLFREHGLGNFRDLAFLVTRDAAMLSYLNGFQNRDENPNENYARELMELFVLGREDLNGKPNYTQDDVVQLARACTGFGLEYKRNRRTDNVILYSDNFDAGVKTALRRHALRGHREPRRRERGRRALPGRPQHHRHPVHAHRQRRPADRGALPREQALGVVRVPAARQGRDRRPARRCSSSRRTTTSARCCARSSSTTSSTRTRRKSGTAQDAGRVRQPAHQRARARRATGRPCPARSSAWAWTSSTRPRVNGWNHSEAWLATARFRERFYLAQRIASGRTKKDNGYQTKVDKLLDPSVTSSGDIVDDDARAVRRDGRPGGLAPGADRLPRDGRRALRRRVARGQVPRPAGADLHPARVPGPLREDVPNALQSPTVPEGRLRLRISHGHEPARVGHAEGLRRDGQRPRGRHDQPLGRQRLPEHGDPAVRRRGLPAAHALRAGPSRPRGPDRDAREHPDRERCGAGPRDRAAPADDRAGDALRRGQARRRERRRLPEPLALPLRGRGGLVGGQPEPAGHGLARAVTSTRTCPST